MAPTPPLKRQKTNPDEEPKEHKEPPTPSQVPLPPDTPIRRDSVHAEAQESPRSPWYRTWPRKAAPVTQIAREGIAAASDTASEFSSIIKDKVAERTPNERRPSTRSSSLAMTLGKASPSRSLPSGATTTKIHAIPNARSPSRKGSSQPDLSVPNGHGNGSTDKIEEPQDQKKDMPKVPKAKVAVIDPDIKPQQELAKVPVMNRASWLDWLPRRDGSAPTQAGVNPQEAPPSASKPRGMTANAAKGDQPTVDAPSKQNLENVKPPEGAPNDPKLENTPSPNNKRTWLQMWSGDTSMKPDPKALPTTATEMGQTEPISQAEIPNISQSETPAKSAEGSKASSMETGPPPQLSGDESKSSGWVFWSRNRKGATTTSLTDEQPHVGEIAISDTPSQSKPRKASISVPKDQTPQTDPKLVKQGESSKKPAPAQIESLKKVEKERPQTPATDKKDQTKTDSKTTKLESPNATARSQEPTDAKSIRTASPVPSKKPTGNLLLPAFKDTLSLEENPSVLQQLARLFYYTKEPELKHLSIVKGPPRIRNALAIGVHGYFPGPMVRTILGQPTGTSIKFADMAAKSIKKWTRGRGYDCQVKTAALEGEGKIAERVGLLWRLLLNWIDEIRKSDFVMVACHSQGVPVAIMLVAKLIQFGCITSARVGICAMAGVSMGPFAEYKSRWISGSAGELFEFSDAGSRVSSDYVSALEVILWAGVRLTFIGSIDDQLVSLESSIFAPVTHPHIYRAVSIDSRVHAPNFLSHLVGFVLKLRNLGVQDHGLIRELSSPLAGSLYTGEGHSRIYEDDLVYDLAVSFALETTSLPNLPLSKRNTTSSGGNPYILPFAMRGILEEDFVRSELQEEAQELLKQFDDWRPTTKALKDVKFRLEGVRSKL